MAQTEKFQRSLEKFAKAFNKYKEIVKSEGLFDFLNEELIIEVTTKRFEYVFESLWKVLKEYLREEGLDCPTPIRCFKEAFKIGLIQEKEEGIFVEMVEKRNQIAHVYDLERAKVIYDFVRSEEVFCAINNIFEKLKQLILFPLENYDRH